MAIIQSILVGKGRGKIGNVVLSVIKGQTIAKALNPAPANPKSTKQVTSRRKMSNVVMLYQYLALFLSMAFAARKPLESIYNAFVRVTKNLMQNTVYENGWSVLMEFVPAPFTFGNWISISSQILDGANLTLTFETGGEAYNALSHVRHIGFIAGQPTNTIVDRAITEAEWNAGSLVLVTTMPDLTSSGIYLYTTDGKKVTDVQMNSF